MRRDLLERRLRQPLVLGLRSNEPATILREQKPGDRRLALGIHPIEGDEPASRPQREERVPKQLAGFVVIEVVQHSDGKHDIEGARKLGRRFGDGRANEGSFGTPALLRVRDICRIRIEADVFDVGQILNDIRGSATQIQDAIAFPRLNEFGKMGTAALAAHDGGERAIDSRVIQNVAEVHI